MSLGSLMLSDMPLGFFFKQKTAYEMRISDWSSDVCSSDLVETLRIAGQDFLDRTAAGHAVADHHESFRSEEHTSELQSLMRISYAVFCLKKKKLLDINKNTNPSYYVAKHLTSTTQQQHNLIHTHIQPSYNSTKTTTQ